MPNFLQEHPPPDALRRASAWNHRQMWIHGARLRGGEVRHENGATWIFTPGSPGEVQIAFPRVTRAAAGEQLDAIVEYCRDHRPLRHVACWSLEPSRPGDLGVRLLARGFEWGWQPHWMVLDLHAMRTDHPTPRGLRVAPVEAPLNFEGGDLPYYDREDAAYWPAESRARPRRKWYFAAWLDEQVVGHSSAFVTTGRLGVAGIYGCGVVPAARNRGVGTAVTLAACQHAAQVGCRYALLNATGMGEPVYRRIGFHSLGRGQTWWLHRGVLDAPPPPATQVRFVEAVGRGDVAALAELAATLEPETLDATLPCGLTPLQVAVRTKQAVSAEWLVARGAVLDVVSAWDLGWKERVPPLLAAAPELANRRSGGWQTTPLHVAAERGDADLARAVLAADPDMEIEDTHFHATPLGWARHLQRAKIVALIEEHQGRRG
jgi:GNAT superfamily N-acetyltransferase